jgi:hypothetical protein
MSRYDDRDPFLVVQSRLPGTNERCSRFLAEGENR